MNANCCAVQSQWCAQSPVHHDFRSTIRLLPPKGLPAPISFVQPLMPFLGALCPPLGTHIWEGITASFATILTSCTSVGGSLSYPCSRGRVPGPGGFSPSPRQPPHSSSTDLGPFDQPCFDIAAPSSALLRMMARDPSIKECESRRQFAAPNCQSSHPASMWVLVPVLLVLHKLTTGLGTLP